MSVVTTRMMTDADPFIAATRIIDMDTTGNVKYLSKEKIASASAYLSDDFGNVVLSIEVDGAANLYIVQSIDLDWIS